jgi:hypothetical protein
VDTERKDGVYPLYLAVRELEAVRRGGDVLIAASADPPMPCYPYLDTIALFR